MNSFCTLLGGVVAWLSVCAPPHPGSYDARRFGYSETTGGRGLVTEAMARVNVIIDARDRLTVVPGWDKSSWNKDSVPVHQMAHQSPR
jgi:hypothetical protein